jgi:hypothetical protein
MEKAGYRRLSARLGLAVFLGLAALAVPAAHAAEVPASPVALEAGCAFDGDPDASDFVVLTLILGLGALRRYLRA